MVRDHFKGKGESAHKASYTRIALLSVNFVCMLYCYYGLFTGCWWAIPVLPLVNWVFGVNTSHDGSHFAFSDKWWVNHCLVFTSMPFMYNPLTWYSEHVVEHHCHCNEEEKDVDLFHFYPCRMHKDSTTTGSLLHFSKALLVTGLHLGFGVPLNCATNGWLDRALFAADGHGFENGKRIKLLSVFRSSALHYATLWFHMITFLVFGAMQYYLHGGGIKGIAFALGPYLGANVCFIVFTQVSHIQEGCQTDEALDSGDFFKTQAQTSMDYSEDSKFWNFMSGGLNVQALHHCLPWVSCCHYTDLYPKFLETCKRHGVQPQSAPNLLAAMQSGTKYVVKMNTPGFGKLHVK